jgi:hypothetical protein
MDVTVEGKVVKVGRPKQYRFGEKFFLEIETKRQGNIKAMVSTDSRERPFVGDTVRMDAREIKNGWMSVTSKRNFEVLSHEGKADWEVRKQEWVAGKRLEREAQWKTNVYGRKVTHDVFTEYGEELKENLSLKRSPGIAVKVGEVLKVLHKKRKVTEGIGGEIDYGGGYGHPGTGLRGPHQPLYNEPHNIRRATLDEGVKAGLWTYDEATGVYEITERGDKLVNQVFELDKKRRLHSLAMMGAELGYREGYLVRGRDKTANPNAIIVSIRERMQKKDDECYVKRETTDRMVKALVGCKEVVRNNYSYEYECTPEQQYEVDIVMHKYYDAVRKGVKEAFV